MKDVSFISWEKNDNWILCWHANKIGTKCVIRSTTHQQKCT